MRGHREVSLSTGSIRGMRRKDIEKGVKRGVGENSAYRDESHSTKNALCNHSLMVRRICLISLTYI